jgi:hypothetical protein
MNKITQAIVLVGLFTVTSACYGASDGKLGPTSTASMNISLIVKQNIQVKSLSDMQLNATEGDNPSDVMHVSTGCVVSNYRGGAYRLTASSRNGMQAGNYHLQSQQGDKIPYQLSASDGSSDFSKLGAGAVQLNASRDGQCRDGQKLHLQAQLANGAPLQAGQFNDVMTLSVMPV